MYGFGFIRKDLQHKFVDSEKTIHQKDSLLCTCITYLVGLLHMYVIRKYWLWHWFLLLSVRNPKETQWKQTPVKSDKTERRLARRRFSQKINKWICFVCFFACHGKQNKFVYWFLGKSKARPNCFWFYLTFTYLQNIYSWSRVSDV